MLIYNGDGEDIEGFDCGVNDKVEYSTTELAGVNIKTNNKTLSTIYFKTNLFRMGGEFPHSSVDTSN